MAGAESWYRKPVGVEIQLLLRSYNEAMLGFFAHTGFGHRPGKARRDAPRGANFLHLRDVASETTQSLNDLVPAAPVKYEVRGLFW